MTQGQKLDTTFPLGNIPRPAAHLRATFVPVEISIKNFRYCRFYRVFGDWPATEEVLSAKLAAQVFEPCGALGEKSSGFEVPTEDTEAFSRRVSGADLLKVRLQTRILPPAAVREALADRIDAYKARTRTEPSRAEVRELKDEVYGKLLPQALLKSERIFAMFLRSESLLVVGTASEKVADQVIEDITKAIDELRIVPVVFRKPVSELMNRVFLGDGPPEFTLGRECRMRDPNDAATSVSWLDIDLGDRSVRQHIRDGLQLDRIGLAFDHVVRFALDTDLVIRKLQLEGIDGLDEIPDEDPLAKFDAELALAAGTITRLFDALKDRLGGFGS